MIVKKPSRLAIFCCLSDPSINLLQPNNDKITIINKVILCGLRNIDSCQSTINIYKPKKKKRKEKKTQ